MIKAKRLLMLIEKKQEGRVLKYTGMNWGGEI